MPHWSQLSHPHHLAITDIHSCPRGLACVGCDATGREPCILLLHNVALMDMGWNVYPAPRLMDNCGVEIRKLGITLVQIFETKASCRHGSLLFSRKETLESRITGLYAVTCSICSSPFKTHQMSPQVVCPSCLWISNVWWVPARCIFPIRPLPLFLNLVILTGCKKILWRLQVYFGYWECFFSFIWVLFVFFQKVPVWTFHFFLPWSVPAPSFLYGNWEPNTGLLTLRN